MSTIFENSSNLTICNNCYSFNFLMKISLIISKKWHSSGYIHKISRQEISFTGFHGLSTKTESRKRGYSDNRTVAFERSKHALPILPFLTQLYRHNFSSPVKLSSMYTICHMSRKWQSCWFLYRIPKYEISFISIHWLHAKTESRRQGVAGPNW